MSTITIPANLDLPKVMSESWGHLNAWYASNNVHTMRVTASRPVVMTADTIDRWEIVGSTDQDPWPTGNNVSRRGGYELQDDEQWTTDNEFAIAIHHVTSPIVEPMPDELRTALETALKAASA